MKRGDLPGEHRAALVNGIHERANRPSFRGPSHTRVLASVSKAAILQLDERLLTPHALQQRRSERELISGRVAPEQDDRSPVSVERRLMRQEGHERDRLSRRDGNRSLSPKTGRWFRSTGARRPVATQRPILSVPAVGPCAWSTPRPRTRWRPPKRCNR